MKKQTLVITILAVFLISFASASLAPFLSNTVTATVNIIGLDLFANADNLLTLDSPSNNIALTVITESEQSVWELEFTNELLFYNMDIELFVDAMVEFTDNPDPIPPTVPITLEFGYINGNSKEELCGDTLDVNTNGNLNIYSIKCSNVDGEKLMDGFYYIVRSQGHDVEYQIQLKEADTRVEIRGVQN